MKVDALLRQRFKELDEEVEKVWRGPPGNMNVNYEAWWKWITSALSLLESVFGVESSHHQNLRSIHDKFNFQSYQIEGAIGVFRAARRDYESGYLFHLEARVSGEIFGDFVTLAKRSLSEGYKDVAAVLVCAALEDCLKRYAMANELQVDGKNMQDIVGALKGKGLVSGAQKSLLDSMPKIRDFSMHANWEKITPESVGGVIGFVENFLLTHF
jgi:hypothetical protein